MGGESWDWELTDEESAFLAGWFVGRGIEGDPTEDELRQAIEALGDFLEEKRAGHG